MIDEKNYIKIEKHENGSTTYWYKDGSSILITYNGIRAYYNPAGFLHRKNGPAYIDPTLYKIWYNNGSIHREDGPAIIYETDFCEWRLHGREYDNIDEWLKDLNIDEDEKVYLKLKFNKKYKEGRRYV